MTKPDKSHLVESKFNKPIMKKRKLRKPRDLRGGYAHCYMCGREVPLVWKATHKFLQIKQLKRFHEWLSKAIEYLEQEK